jgi:threonine dehydratase
MTSSPNYKDILKAEENLREILNPTNLIFSEVFSSEYGNQVYIKPENLQKTGAFKIRGAYNMIKNLSEKEKEFGLICSSAGNHAQGVAYSAKELGVPATIVMPRFTPFIKVEGTKKLGAKVILSGNVYDEAYDEAVRIQEEKNMTFVHPFESPDVIAGQGTIGLEIYEELSDVDYVIVPVGGGGLISGISIALKELNPNIKVIGVEPSGADAMKRSLENLGLTYLQKVDTIADGVAVRKPGKLTYSIIKEYVDQIVTVDDFELMDALILLIEKHKIISEPSGALALAAISKLGVKDKKIVSLVSGGNIDLVTISSMINKGLVSRGRLLCFSVNLPDTPGQLQKISQILADNNANIIKLDHNQFKSTDRLLNVQLEVTVETNGHKHIDKIMDSILENGYTLSRVY